MDQYVDNKSIERDGVTGKDFDERARKFFRFTDVDPLLRPGEGRLYAAVVTGAFHDCMLRIVVRHHETRLFVEVDALDVTTLPVLPRQNDYEYLCRLVKEARVLHEAAATSPEALTRFLSDVGSVNWFEIDDDTRSGLDGCEFIGAVSDGRGMTNRFSAWCAEGEGSLYLRFLSAMHRLAVASMRGGRILAALDALPAYVELGDISGR